MTVSGEWTPSLALLGSQGYYIIENVCLLLYSHMQHIYICKTLIFTFSYRTVKVKNIVLNKH